MNDPQRRFDGPYGTLLTNFEDRIIELERRVKELEKPHQHWVNISRRSPSSIWSNPNEKGPHS